METEIYIFWKNEWNVREENYTKRKEYSERVSRMNDRNERVNRTENLNKLI